MPETTRKGGRRTKDAGYVPHAEYEKSAFVQEHGRGVRYEVGAAEHYNGWRLVPRDPEVPMVMRRRRVVRRPGEKRVVLFVRIREDDRVALDEWVREAVESGAWPFTSVSDIVRELISAALRARKAEAGV